MRILTALMASAVSSITASTGSGAEINDCPIRPATICVEFNLPAVDLPGARLSWAVFL